MTPNSLSRFWPIDRKLICAIRNNPGIFMISLRVLMIVGRAYSGSSLWISTNTSHDLFVPSGLTLGRNRSVTNEETTECCNFGFHTPIFLHIKSDYRRAWPSTDFALIVGAMLFNCHHTCCVVCYVYTLNYLDFVYFSVLVQLVWSHAWPYYCNHQSHCLCSMWVITELNVPYSTHGTV